MTVGKDDNGHATLQTTGCSLDVGGVSVDFHGGASWLYNLFDGTIEDLVEDKMQTEVCSTNPSHELSEYCCFCVIRFVQLFLRQSMTKAI